MILTIILILVCSGLSAFICYKCLQPRLQATIELDVQTANTNELLKKENEQLCSEFDQLTHQHDELVNRNNILNTENRFIDNQIQEKRNSLSLLEEQSKQSADIFYQKNMEIAQTNLEESLEKERKKYCRAIEELTEGLKTAQEEEVAEYLSTIAIYKEEFIQLTSQIEQLRADTNAAISAAKRAEEMKESKDFYRIKLTSEDVEEIEKLRSILPCLRDKEPLNKVIWKVYYEKPVNDLIGRVIGPGNHTGIYKITDIDNEKCYIGQAANLADRWKQHIKRGVGAETPTRNKLYPVMLEKGPENFTFEVLEECDRVDLDTREDYFQEFYQAMTWGYSIK